jgi:hypothetical protein
VLVIPALKNDFNRSGFLLAEGFSRMNQDFAFGCFFDGRLEAYPYK